MKFDAYLLSQDLQQMPALSRAIEAQGFDGIWAAETNSDPFLPLTLAAEHTQRLSLGTAIAVAFPRSPTVLAHLAWDLQRLSRGRFVLGLGAQVKAHIVLRFGARWDKPVRQMRETIEAIRAVWASWQTGKRLDYRGEYFMLQLMPPFFSGGALETPPPPIYIAAVNEQMLHLAGSHCEGVHLHPFHTATYLRDYAWPHLHRGLSKAGRSRAEFTAVAALFVVPTDGSKPASHYEQFVAEQLAFYMSTPSYRTIVDLHGWGEVATRLSLMARRGQWAEMPALITDEMLDACAVSGKWGELPRLIQARYEGQLLDRVAYYLPYTPGEDDQGWAASLAGFHHTAQTG